MSPVDPPDEPPSPADDLDSTQPVDPAATIAGTRTPSTDAPAEHISPLGTWGPLELLDKVGEGAFGETFRARDPRLDRDVALKLLKSDASQQSEVAGRVIREGALLARVSHPNVVTVYGAERHDDRVGLWMEFVRGRTLEALLREQDPFGEHETAVMGLHLCRALAAVHTAGIIHRDIKDANVMREEGGRLVLMDFGAGEETAEAAGQSSMTGTPYYMAPELFTGGATTVASDLYSVGVVLYHLVTGAYPVTGSSLRELADAHASGVVRHLRDVRAELSAPFVEVVARCLAPDPGARFETAGALETALAQTITGTGTGGERPAATGADATTFDFTAWRHARIAEWSRPRYRLDTEFVALTLLIDQGEESASGRWSAQPERYQDLGALLAATEDPALVVLGPPGCGKSTLLRRLELDVATAALDGGDDRVTFFLQLNHYPAPGRGETPAAPGMWLADRWRARFPELPSFDDLIAQGRMVLLLDALNEIPAPSPASLREAITAWKSYCERLITEHPGNRVIFSCRALDYSAPLSTPRLRVPQIQIEPMSDEQVEQYLTKHAPDHGASVWKALVDTPQLEVMRSPYFLSLLLEQVHATGEMPEGRAGLFTGFIRQALKREIERDNPLFAPDGLLTERDVRRVTRWRWKSTWELPERGALVPQLATLAFAMQDASGDGGASQVRIDVDEALELLDDERDEDIVRAGVALSVLDEDAASDEVLFFHQLLQEYFAGRKLGAHPDAERVRVPWKATDITPSVREVLETLPRSEVLPALPTTGWEETTLLAAVMTDDPDAFLRELMGTNLALAGRCAGQVEVRERLSSDLLDALREALVTRSTDRAADLRARIAAALALGPLGDPRFERRTGPHGDYLLPPMIEVPGGRYPMGEDEPLEYMGEERRSHTPRHEVELAPFRIARYPVTNAEWACFQQSGGYEDERWWDTVGARRWRSGAGTADGDHLVVRYWLGVFRADPEKLETAWAKGQMTELTYERIKRRLVMTEAELAAHLRELYPGGVLREPKCWCDGAFNNPAQPVVGVSWYEARAYTSWLTAQTGERYRLPTEAEWEAAARGGEGRRYAYGETFDALGGNTSETCLKRPTPVGVFVTGETPDGLSDLAGNVAQWTASLFGPGTDDVPAFAYPYVADDGREDPEAGADVRRVLRGGAWVSTPVSARTARRYVNLPDFRLDGIGFRVASLR